MVVWKFKKISTSLNINYERWREKEPKAYNTSIQTIQALIIEYNSSML